jgi:hypothetical protein
VTELATIMAWAEVQLVAIDLGLGLQRLGLRDLDEVGAGMFMAGQEACSADPGVTTKSRNPSFGVSCTGRR